MITQPMLWLALSRILERKPFISDWRKLPNGRIVRFIDWGAAR